MKRISFLLLVLLLVALAAKADKQPEYSTAGFYELPNVGRSVVSMNPAWRFHKGSVAGAECADFEDKDWAVVSLPHGIEYVPLEASGCVNYQGEVWYRKHFTPEAALEGKQLLLHFEAIMGKSKIYVNGKLVKEHFGGYLPAVADISKEVVWGKENVIAVWADNSDDPIFPPGKSQEVLDFTYFGGIYRDCWMVAHSEVFVTDANQENEVAGGGLLVAYDRVSEKAADVLLQVHVRNRLSKSFSGEIAYHLYQKDGKEVAHARQKISINAGKAVHSKRTITVKQPQLWSPDSPTLYDLHVSVVDRKGTVVDGFRKRIGIRSFDFKEKDGFWLNGKPYPRPLMGANRHQDFAIVGNAVPNSLHWRDAKKLKDAGMAVIRNAHCPQDPAFMDACDELGLFVIVNTPGWQFWNKAPIFEQRVYQDIRNLVRRDRNHPSVWLWEPILNETHYPAEFAKNTRDIVDEEFPYPSCFSACDSKARGNECFDIHFTHPINSNGKWALKEADPTKTYFTREWGDNVDDWSAHNSPSRVARNWGEQAMLIQANHYAKPPYVYTSYDALHRTTRQHVGGTLWHSFDHQRGYHPDPFYGGVMDAFRQPKYSYYMFQAQRPKSQPMVYIAHEMTPFSGKDVTVYSNCDEVRLTYLKGGKTYTYNKPDTKVGMPSPIIVFKDVYDFMIDKNMSMDEKKQDEVFLLAEGYVDGELVATHRVAPARRPSKLLLWVDSEDVSLEANGSDVVTVVAAVADGNGNIKHLNNYALKFSISGEGRLLGDASIMANPAPVRWGTAPVLVQSTLLPGDIKVTVQTLLPGTSMPISGEITLKSIAPKHALCYDKEEAKLIPLQAATAFSRRSSFSNEEEKLRQTIHTEKLKEVEAQQADFGEKR